MTHTRIVTAEEIAAVLPRLDLVAAMERAFVAQADGRAQLSAVGELLFHAPAGEAHIKGGHIAGQPVFVVKVATGFYDNPARGLPSSSGLVVVLSADTGEPVAVMLDGGRLTDLRTAAAGAVAAKHLAPPDVGAIGIVGAGIQARLQADLLRSVTSCRRVVLFARRADAALACARDLRALGFEVDLVDSPAQVAARANLIVTTTPARTPLLNLHDVRPGTHITAIGADTPGKQELDPRVITSADLVAVDDLTQCEARGELQHAHDGSLHRDRIVTLGSIVAGRNQGRTTDAQITVADLTGVATQDIEIATEVLAALDDRGAP